MKSIISQVFILLAFTANFAKGTIVLSNLVPQNGATISTVDGSVTFSVIIKETQASIRDAYIDARADGTRMFRLSRMSQVSGTDRYEYDVDNLVEGVKYCFRVRARNTQNKKKWAKFSCFTVDVGTPTPTTMSTSAPTAVPTATPTLNGITYGLQPDCYEDNASKFSICLDLTSGSGKVEPFMAYFAGAREKWENVINTNGIYYTRTSSLNTDYTATGSYPSVIDGMYISSYVKSIDGEYGILGSAGPVYTLTMDGYTRPMTGLMNFDADDLDWMDADGILEGVIKHEMGHVLGIGTMWNNNGLINYPDGNLYLGTNVLSAWSAQGCDVVDSGAPIVEMDGGGGTAGAHFDEECFDEELMTGYVDQGMVLSFLTVASLADMGYDVDFAEAGYFSLAGSCCSSRRQLRGEPPSKKRFSERRLTPENREKAIAFGKSEIRRLHDNNFGIGLDPEMAIMDTIKVYMLQDGHVIDIEVSMNDDIPL